MWKSTIVRVAAAAAVTLAVSPVAAAVLGPYAAACEAGKPAMLVRVEGFKSRTGIVRVQSYGGDPANFFAKGSYLARVDVHVPPSGPVEICMPVPQPGVYAASVRHDVNGSGKSDLADGGGTSGNPRMSLLDVVLRRKPDPSQVAVHVRGTTPVPVVLNYVQGGAVRPVAVAGR